MQTFIQYHEAAAVLIARVFLGLLFFFQGYDAVFTVRIKNVIEAYRQTFTSKGIPTYLLVMACWFTAGTELAGGVLLLLGLFKYLVLYLLGLNLLIAATGFGINTPMWDTRHVMPRLILLLLLLLLPQAADIFSIDHFIKP